MTVAPDIREIEFPAAYSFLFEPHRYKVARSGRGAAKSWSFAEALLLLGAERNLRIGCARETQKSIKDSVHALLADWIERLHLAHFYHVQQHEIFGDNGTTFSFHGLKQMNITNIKSLEGLDILWVEEGQNVSKRSWELVIPTVRKDYRQRGLPVDPNHRCEYVGCCSEIWCSYNPELETDETHMRFAVNTPPPGAVVVTTSWRDNPWFPEVLRVEMQHLQATDPVAYEHVWEGACRSAVEGAVFGEEMKKALLDNRVTDVPLDRTKPVDTFWDLGFGDATAIWFMQPVGGAYHLIDYLEDEGQSIEWYVIQLQQKGYVYGTDHLPHDAVDAIIHKRLAGDKSRSIEMIMRSLGRKVRVTPKLYVTDQINAARMILSQCRFDQTKCYEGLRALRSYQWGPKTEVKLSTGATTQVAKREPIHDWACFTQDTEVWSNDGPCKIMDLPSGGKVLTPCGWREYEGPRITRRSAQLVEVQFSDGNTVQCTPEHLFLTVDGWRSAESLTPGTSIQSCLTPSRNTSTAASTAYIRLTGITRRAAAAFTGTSGRVLSATFRRAAQSIIEIVTAATTPSAILNASLSASIAPSVAQNGLSLKVAGSPSMLFESGMSGFRVKKQEPCIGDSKNDRLPGSSGDAKRNRASNAARLLTRWFGLVLSRKSTAGNAAECVRISTVKPLSNRADVCCIHVPDIECFALANGAVVHNSHGASAFMNFAVTARLPKLDAEEKKREIPRPPTIPGSYTPFG